MAITATLLALGAAGALAKGAGQIGAARAGKLSRAEKEELARIEKARAEGNLGLTEKQDARLEQQFLGQRGGSQRQAQQLALQQQTASGPVSGRDVFLREQARSVAERGMAADQNLQRAQADSAAAAQQRQRATQLRGQEIQAKAATRAAVGQTIGDTLSFAGDIGMLGAMGKIDPAFGGEMDAWLQNATSADIATSSGD
jgi:hypothetical protein